MLTQRIVDFGATNWRKKVVDGRRYANACFAGSLRKCVLRWIFRKMRASHDAAMTSEMDGGMANEVHLR
jgi:hypothetical protein